MMAGASSALAVVVVAGGGSLDAGPPKLIARLETPAVDA